MAMCTKQSRILENKLVSLGADVWIFENFCYDFVADKHVSDTWELGIRIFPLIKLGKWPFSKLVWWKLDLKNVVFSLIDLNHCVLSGCIYPCSVDCYIWTQYALKTVLQTKYNKYTRVLRWLHTQTLETRLLASTSRLSCSLD